MIEAEARKLVAAWYPGAKPEVIAKAASLLKKYSEQQAERIMLSVASTGLPPSPSRVKKAGDDIDKADREERARRVWSEERQRALEEFERHQRISHRARVALRSFTAEQLVTLYDDTINSFNLTKFWMDTA